MSPKSKISNQLDRCLVAILVCAAFCVNFTMPSAAATFTVTTLSDFGPGSLRDAMDQANANTGADDIVFAVDGTIFVTFDLPTLLDDQTRILGETGPSVCGATPKVMLRNAGATAGIRIFGADFCEIRGLHISDFPTGIEIAGGAFGNILGDTGPCEDNLISNNGVGLRVTDPGSDYTQIKKNTISFNSNEGVHVIDGPRGTTFGAGVLTDSNSIYGNGAEGILIQSISFPVNFTQIYSNCIGCEEATGTVFGNVADGIRIDGADSTIVRDSYMVDNGGSGLVIENGAQWTDSSQNFMGLDPWGNPRGNLQHGIDVRGGAQNSSLTADTSLRNALNGIRITGLGTDNNTVRLANFGFESVNYVGLGNLGYGASIEDRASNNTLQDCFLTSNNLGGLYIGSSADSNLVDHAAIGTDWNGITPLGNSGNGITIDDSANNNEIRDSIISGNSGYGIYIGESASSNGIYGNEIGLHPLGATALANGIDGIGIQGSFNNVGNFGEPGNIISGNQEWGIRVSTSFNSTQNNLILGNDIGLNRYGNPLGNDRGGIRHDAGTIATQIGSYPSQPDKSNNIKHNNGAGIYFDSSSGSAPRAHQIVRNQIGDNNGPGILFSGTVNDNIPAPVVTSATVSSVEGTVNHPGFAVEVLVYYDANDEGCHYLGSVTVPSGQTNWVLNNVQIPTGSKVTANATSGWPFGYLQSSDYATHFAMVQLDAGDGPALPKSLGLTLAGANPVRSGHTQLQFAVPAQTEASVQVYGVDGRLVREIKRGTFEPGTHQLTWDGTDESGRKVASGTYVMAARTAEGTTKTARVTMLR